MKNHFFSVHKHSTLVRLICMGTLPFLLGGCVRTPRYKPKPLHTLSSRFDAHNVSEQVTVRVKRLNKHDVKDLFGHRGSWLVRNRRAAFVPLHVSIYNHGSCTLLTGPEYISLKTVPHEVIASRMRSSGGMWAFGTLLFGWPAGIALFASGMFAIAIGANVGSGSMVNAGWVAWATGLGLTVATPFLAMGNAVRSTEANKEVELDLTKKIMASERFIKSYEHYQTLVFIRRADYTKDFSISFTVVDDTNTTITVGLQLP